MTNRKVISLLSSLSLVGALGLGACASKPKSETTMSTQTTTKDGDTGAKTSTDTTVKTTTNPDGTMVETTHEDSTKVLPGGAPASK